VSGFFTIIFGVPPSRAARDRAYSSVVGDLDDMRAFERILGGMQHNTEKAGALLAAQGIFAVACTYGIDHGWPRLLAIPAILLLLVGALLAISMLRSTAAPFTQETGNVSRKAFDLLVSRMIRFNLALYMTFLSIILLGAAALSDVL
jgi:hypothetical protein